jgi:peptidoglycan/xylan/chitin deacetylase (PgdA/CDA1 family)
LRGLRRRFLAALRVRGRSRLLRAIGLPLSHLIGRAARLSDRGVGIALVYHRVGDPPGDPRRELVPALGTELFAGQVRHLVSSHRPVRASELLAATRERRRGERFPVAITFDDDLSSHLGAAGPILAAVGATGTFFVSGASLRRPYRFWWERLQAAVDAELDLTSVGLEPMAKTGGIHAVGRAIEKLPPRSRDELNAKLAKLVGPDPPDSGLRAEALRRLAEAGLEIGFHTRRHDLLPMLGDERLRDAMQQGRAEVEKVVGSRLFTISYPHGRADPRVAAAARAAGFEAGFTGVPVAVTSEADSLLLGRLAPSYTSVGELAFDVACALFRAAFGRRA